METVQDTPESLYRHAARHGGMVGVLMVMVTIVVYMISISFMGSLWFVLLAFAFYIGYVIWAGIGYRNATGGYLSFGRAFVHGFMVLAVASFINLLFGLLLYQVIDPDLATNLVDAIISNTEESMRNFGAPEDRIEEQMAGMRSSMGDNFTPLGQVKNYFTGLIWNAVLVLITSLVVRKSEPVEM